MNYCLCGQIEDSTTWHLGYSYAIYDSQGEVIYAICQHGNVVINKLPEDDIRKHLSGYKEKDYKFGLE